MGRGEMRYAVLWAAAFGATAVAHAGEPQSAARASAPARSELSNPVAKLRLEDMRITRERPLFSPTRRPPQPVEAIAPVTPPAPVQAKEEVAAPPPFDLVGSVVGASASYVLLLNRETHEMARLSQGGEAAGWKVGIVSQRSVVLERDGRRVTLSFAQPATSGASPAPELATAAPSVPPQPTSWAETEYKRLKQQLKLR